MGEIDVALDGAGVDEEDELPAEPSSPVTQVGDLWIAGEHHIFCGDALSPASYETVLGADCAEMVFADPPYNVEIAGNVSGLGATKHDEFAMASGEMSPAEFARFLKDSFSLVARHSIDGAIHFICMDWRHVEELMGATKEIYSELKNICVWNKSNAGMGSLYRSKHEFIFVFKNGKKPHINNIALGRFGRSRTNVWDYASQNVLSGTSKGKLALHPTVKPVGLIRCYPRLLQPQWHYPRSVRRSRHHIGCGREDRAPSPSDRDRSSLRRRCNSTLAAPDGKDGTQRCH